MDPNTRLDYVLFQLTPTRTRCDLVIFAGGVREKLASGFLDPFLSHLKTARDHIPKGGYSIDLRPDSNSPWFTKGTLERFVRFVSTPEILERLLTIEQEISQIDDSIRANDVSNLTTPNVDYPENSEGDPEKEQDVEGNTRKSRSFSKLQNDSIGDDATQGENTRLRLLQVLESRKIVLRKEQGMAYARAFVAGFELGSIDDLICFANAFGASRLREACMKFKDLCKKKHEDRLWMDELEAMKACVQPFPNTGPLGIVLTTENNFSDGSTHQNTIPDSSIGNQDTVLPKLAQMSEGNAQVPMSWSNLPPHYMYPFQIPGMQQTQPYPGFSFPPVHSMPPYYPGHPSSVPWGPYTEESGYSTGGDRHYRPNRPMSKSAGRRSHRASESGFDSQDESDNSGSSSDSEADANLQNDSESDRKESSAQKQKKKSRKKSSRTVVIRNINYITPNRRNGDKDKTSEESSGEDDFIDGDSLKKQVEDAVGSLEKHHKSNHHKKRSNHKDIGDSKDLINSSNENFDSSTFENNERDGSWNAFQKLLMKTEESDLDKIDEESKGKSLDEYEKFPLNVEDEYCVVKNFESGQPSDDTYNLEPESNRTRPVRERVPTDSFVVTDRNGRYEDPHGSTNFSNDGDFTPNIKRMSHGTEELIFSHRAEPDRVGPDSLSDYSSELASKINNQRGGDWFIIGQPEKVVNGKNILDKSIFDGDHVAAFPDSHTSIKRVPKDLPIDESFVIPTRDEIDEQPFQLATDMCIVSGFSSSDILPENQASNVSKNSYSADEPDDLYMILERNAGLEISRDTWMPDVEYTMDISFADTEKGSASDGQVQTSNNNATNDSIDPKSKNGNPSKSKQSIKDPTAKSVRGSLVKSRSEIVSRSKKPPVNRGVLHKNKMEQEEENRKRMEELRIERQRRIAERSAASGVAVTSSKLTRSTSSVKQPPVSRGQESRTLNLRKQNTLAPSKDRLTSGKTPPKGTNISMKPASPNKSVNKVDVKVSTSTSMTSTKVSSSENSKSKLSEKGITKSDSKRFISSHSGTKMQDIKEHASHSNSIENNESSLNEIKSVADNDPLQQVSSISMVDKEISSPILDSLENRSPESDSCKCEIRVEESLISPPPVHIEELPKERITSQTNECIIEVVPEVNIPLEYQTPTDSQAMAGLKLTNIAEEKEIVEQTSQANGHATTDSYLTEKVVENPYVELKTSDVNAVSKEIHDASLINTVKEDIPECETKSSSISELEIDTEPFKSTPPPADCENSEPVFVRKKWSNSNGSSIPSAKGLKKLLKFGRKKSNVVYL